SGYSGWTFTEERLRRGEISPLEIGRALLVGLDVSLAGGDPLKFFEASIAALKGRSDDELTELGERLFIQKIAGMVYPESRALIEAHQRKGHTIVLASSATPYQLG